MILDQAFRPLTQSPFSQLSIEEEQSLREQGAGIRIVTMRLVRFRLKPKASRLHISSWIWGVGDSALGLRPANFLLDLGRIGHDRTRTHRPRLPASDSSVARLTH